MSAVEMRALGIVARVLDIVALALDIEGRLINIKLSTTKTPKYEGVRYT